MAYDTKAFIQSVGGRSDAVEHVIGTLYEILGVLENEDLESGISDDALVAFAHAGDLMHLEAASAAIRPLRPDCRPIRAEKPAKRKAA